jgi:hypothetical protein
MKLTATIIGLITAITLSIPAKASDSLAAGLPASSYSQSWFWPGTTSDALSAFNGGDWHAEQPPGKQWIQADMLTPKWVDEVRFVIGQDLPGVTSFAIYLSDSPIAGNWAQETPVAAVSGFTTTDSWIDLKFDPTRARYVEILASGWPNWTDLGLVKVLPVPEPASPALMAVGLLLPGAFIRRRRA